MAAKKKKTAKKSQQRIPNKDRVLEMGDLTKAEQRDAVGMVSRVSETMPETMAGMAESHLKSPKSAMRSKGRRYAKAASQMVSKPLTMESMVEARKSAFHEALAGTARLPEEDYGGQEFYFKHRAELNETAGTTDIPISRLVDATGRLSIQTKPEPEKAALRALAQAHTHGAIHFSPELVKALGNKVPTEMHNQKVPFKELPGNVVRELTNPDIRHIVQPHAHGVDITNLAKTSMRNNLKQAHEALQGKKVDPIGNPKLHSYARSHELAVTDSPEHREYQMRAMHLGQVARGEQSNRQLMFDFYGLRNSNEGILSNNLQTANDSWMLANQYQQPEPVRKISGDINMKTKKTKTKRGRVLSVGDQDATISTAGIQHAVGAGATTQAAKELQDEMDVDYTIPSVMVQEGVWAAERRKAGGDAEFNARKKQEKKAAKDEAKAAKDFAIMNPDRQLSLFDDDHNKQVVKDVKKADKLAEKRRAKQADAS